MQYQRKYKINLGNKLKGKKRTLGEVMGDMKKVLLLFCFMNIVTVMENRVRYMVHLQYRSIQMLETFAMSVSGICYSTNILSNNICNYFITIVTAVLAWKEPTMMVKLVLWISMKQLNLNLRKLL